MIGSKKVKSRKGNKYLFDKEQMKQLREQLKRREVFEPLILVSILVLILLGIIGFSIFEAGSEKSKATNNAKMISELGDINSYLNELDENILNNKETLESATVSSAEILQEEMYSSKEDINITIEESVTQLNSRMENLHNKIVETEANISNLLSFLGVEVEENQKEINGQFAAIKNSLEDIKQEFTDMIDEVKDMIEELARSQEANHTELKETLSVMATDMETTATENLDKMLDTLSGMEETYTTLLTDYHTDTIKNIADLNENMVNHFIDTNTNMTSSFLQTDENINNQFESVNQSVENQFKTTNENITNQYTDLTVLMTENDNEMSGYLESIFDSICQKLDSVFTFVSDGKKKLASALLTKGVDCAGDATFEEIKQAILSIPQQLLLGTETKYVYGDIELEHHYHVNGSGEYPHTTVVDAGDGGGCYTTPIYHVHTGSNTSGTGCYSGGTTYTREETRDKGPCEGTHYHGNSYTGVPDKFHCCECCPACDHDHSYTVTVTYYNLNCGKTPQTIVQYKLNCPLVDGQIVAAHIVYTGYDDLPTVNTEPAVASFSLREEAVAYEPEPEISPDLKPDLKQEEELETENVKETETAQEESIDKQEKVADTENENEPESVPEEVDNGGQGAEADTGAESEEPVKESAEEIAQEEPVEETETEEAESSESSGYE